MDYPTTDDLHNGKFTDGDPIAGIPASIASAEHMNALYDELINLIEGAELTPDVANKTQLLEAINYYRNASNMVEGTVPVERLPSDLAQHYNLIQHTDLVGSIHYFAMPVAPNGFIKANGAEVSRTAYADLFAKIGTTFGDGDGSTTFNVPDLRGEFIRGWDDGRGVDEGRKVGSWQNHLIREHKHLGGEKWDEGAGLTTEYEGFEYGAEFYMGDGGSRVVSSAEPIQFSGTGYIKGYTSSEGGPETRPRNIALLACIKY